MSSSVEYSEGRASEAEVAAHLWKCDQSFVPALSLRVNVCEYARKITDQTVRIEAWSGQELVGLLSVYCNDRVRGAAFITNVSVLPQWQARGIASNLMRRCIDHVSGMGFRLIELEVAKSNITAAALYEKHGFVICRATAHTEIMHLPIGTVMSDSRDYDEEIKDNKERKYAYEFDFDVMHPYMLRSFKPFFRAGSVLELGSYKGDFTRRLLGSFDDVTCVEASEAAITEAKRKFGERVQFVNSTFESATLPRRYDNIVLTHVLEHLDDPVRLLRRINEEWLGPDGRLFLVCPNANAPSRQIAVKMGLISHNAAVTAAEAEHGHRCTYSLDTLERDVVAAGLNVIHRSGIFFKALANFQWDRLLQTDIVSKEYLDGCYEVGQLYPNLCSSIFLMCEQGKGE